MQPPIVQYRLSFTPTYIKHFKHFSPTEQKQIERKLRLLSFSPAHPSLRTKRIKGQRQLWESSVNMDIRLIWHYKDGTIIVAIDVGHHDILKQF